MQGNPAKGDESRYDWRPCNLSFPRIGLLLNRDGIHMRLLLPGDYLVRVSRTLGRRIYRRRHVQVHGRWI
jgi:hypothetical protein